MNKYQTLFLIDQRVEEAEIKKIIQKFSDLINSDGKVDTVEEMGTRKLAYEIKKNKEAFFVCIDFEANPELIKELERVYRITDEIIKFIIIRNDEKDKKDTKTENKNAQMDEE